MVTLLPDGWGLTYDGLIAIIVYIAEFLFDWFF